MGVAARTSGIPASWQPLPADSPSGLRHISRKLVAHPRKLDAASAQARRGIRANSSRIRASSTRHPRKLDAASAQARRGIGCE
jgi:hypothetical protein